MLINVRISELLIDSINSIPLAILVGSFFNFFVNNVLPYMVINSTGLSFSNIEKLTNVTSKSWDAYLAETSHITSIGNILYANYSIWLIITSIILLLAMVGCIVITLKEKNNNSEINNTLQSSISIDKGLLLHVKGILAYNWALPQLFSDYLRILKDKSAPGLEWALHNPPKPHAFTSLPLQSDIPEWYIFGLLKRSANAFKSGQIYYTDLSDENKKIIDELFKHYLCPFDNKVTITAKDCVIKALDVRAKVIKEAIDSNSYMQLDILMRNKNWLVNHKVLEKHNLSEVQLEQNRHMFKTLYDTFLGYKIDWPSHFKGEPGFEVDPTRIAPLPSYRSLNSKLVTPEVPVPVLDDRVVPLNRQIGIGLRPSLHSRAPSLDAKTNSTSTSRVYSRIGNEMKEYYNNNDLSFLLIFNLRFILAVITPFCELLLVFFGLILIFLIIPSTIEYIRCSHNLLINIISIIVSLCYSLLILYRIKRIYHLYIKIITANNIFILFSYYFVAICLFLVYFGFSSDISVLLI